MVKIETETERKECGVEEIMKKNIRNKLTSNNQTLAFKMTVAANSTPRERETQRGGVH